MTVPDSELEDLIPTARRIAGSRRWRLDHSGYDDRLGAALLALVLAGRSWDRRLGPFPQWATTKMRFAVIDEVRRRHHYRNGRPRVRTVPLEESMHPGGEDLPPAADRGEVAEVVAAVPKARERQMLFAHVVDGVSQEDVAAQLGVSPSRVSQVLAANRSRLRREAARRL